MDEPEVVEPAARSVPVQAPVTAPVEGPVTAPVEGPTTAPVQAPAAAGAEPAGPLGNLVAAHFQRVEIAMLARVLTTTLAGALPPSTVRVERQRGWLERLLRRPGQPIGVSVSRADRRLTFRAPEVGVTEASVSHVDGGVVLSSRPVPVPDWLALLAALLNQATTDDEAVRQALERALLS